jgi:predicted acyl esterase
MDLFATICAFTPDGKEMTFFAATEPATPVSQRWLRVTQRKLDEACSTDDQPMHAHSEQQPLTPGEIYEVDLEIWPASLHLPKGSRLTLTVQGQDFARPGPGSEGRRGSGPFTHTDGVDRAMPRYDNRHAIHSGGRYASFLQPPVLPN